MRKASLQSRILCKECSCARYIEAEGKCPITGEELDLSDLIDVKSEFLETLSSSLAQPLVKPKPTPATSIPGLLVSLQNEWDSMMLESFTLKKHLQAVRQELSQALYQHEAACRVIARLINERDEARAALARYTRSIPNDFSAWNRRPCRCPKAPKWKWK